MKRTLTRVLSLFLAVLCAAAVLSPAASAAEYYENDLPVVYVIGRGTWIYDKNENKIYPTDGIEKAIKNNVNNLATAWIKSLISPNSDWNELSDAIYKLVEEEYKNYVLDDNGEISNGTHAKPNAEPKAKKSNFSITDYQFSYDGRIDPRENAKLLNEYINKVLTVTGKRKVQLIGRCLGSTVISAYLTMYGCSKVDTAIFYAASNQGIVPLSAFFTGDVIFDCKAIEKYGDGYLKNSASDGSDNLSRSLVTLGYKLSKSFYLTDYVIENVEKAYRDIARTLYPRIVLAVYGTCPGFWTMVRDDYYEKAKQVVFEGKAKYAKLIEKIDWYHYNVFQKFPQTLKKCKQQGMKVAVIAKYNIQLAPLFKDCMKQADNLVELETASYGATCADIKQLLPDSYINAQEKAGKGKYISPDLKVDASTCLFPDYTWFIKDLPHDVFPNSVNELIMKIFHSKEQFTIDSDEQFSQYLQYESNSLLLSKVTELDLADETDSAEISLRKLLNLFNTLFWLLKNLLNIM